MNVSLRYGPSSVQVDLQDENLLGFVEPKEDPGMGGEREVENALQNPINSERLSDIAKRGQNAVVIVDDITRLTPSSKLVPPILDELNKGSIDDENIELIIALGTHRHLTIEERKRLIGEVYKKVRCVDHDVERCVSLNGVDVFEDVAEADVIVCTGHIALHYYAGYTGGSKSILPGVSSFDMIQSNHKKMILPGATPGNINSPVRKEMEEAARNVGVDFILNVILSETGEILKAVAGDVVDAHRIGARYVDELYKVKIKEKADIVITSAGGRPKDINLYQAQKALENAKHAVKDGGSIILVAQCPEGLGDKTFERWMDDAEKPEDLIDRVKRKFELGGHKAVAIAQVMEKADVYLVSEMDTKFFTCTDLQTSLEDAMRKYNNPSILIIPYGTSVLPYVEGRVA